MRRAVRFADEGELRKAVVLAARRELRAVVGGARAADSRGKRVAAVRAVKRGRALSVHQADPKEERVRAAINSLAAALDELDAASREGGKGPLATWARLYGRRVVEDIRGTTDEKDAYGATVRRGRQGMRIPWPGQQPKPRARTLLTELVWRVRVDKRDVLGIRRGPTTRELALFALLRGWYPDLVVKGLTVAEVINRATVATRKLEREVARAAV